MFFHPIISLDVQITGFLLLPMGESPSEDLLHPHSRSMDLEFTSCLALAYAIHFHTSDWVRDAQSVERAGNRVQNPFSFKRTNSPQEAFASRAAKFGSQIPRIQSRTILRSWPHQLINKSCQCSWEWVVFWASLGCVLWLALLLILLISLSWFVWLIGWWPSCTCRGTARWVFVP